MTSSIGQISSRESNSEREEEVHQNPVQPQNSFFESVVELVQQLYHSGTIVLLPVTVQGNRSELSDGENSPSTPILPGSYPKSEVSSSTTDFRSELPSALSPSVGGTPMDSNHEAMKDESYSSQPSASLRFPVNAATIENTASTLQGAHNFTVRDHARITNIVNSVTNYSGTVDLDVMKKFMEEFVSFNAIHDSPSQDPDRQCHPETRRSVLKQVQDWIDDPNAIEPIFWLYGPPGVGKSAIAHTISRSCRRDSVSATFFFCRSDPDRNDGNQLFTTLAWQLALSIPDLKIHILNSINERPDLPRKDVETQFEELIVRPVQALIQLSSRTALSASVIIIDGLDECVNEKLQQRILKVIESAVIDGRLPFRFFISSRPEAHIRATITSFQCPTFLLDLAKIDDANEDIERYLKAEFSRIASEQDLDPTWPGDEKMRIILFKSSGQFIYASTLIKIINDGYNLATTQLDIVLGLRPHNGKLLFAELDGLYVEILKRQEDWEFLNDVLSLFICNFFSVFHSADKIKHDAILMNMPEKELCMKLRGMRSLLKLDPYVDVYHQSFLDFLQDPLRSRQYHISQQSAEKRFFHLITTSIARHVSIEPKQLNLHERHFFLRLYLDQPSLSAEELQEALEPLVKIQDELLCMEKSSWQIVLRCNKCNILQIIRYLLLLLTYHQELSKYGATRPAQTTEHARLCHSTLSVDTDVEQVVLENLDLDVCLSSVLGHLRKTESSSPPNAVIIGLIQCLVRFDFVETAMKVQSISDGQLLVDVIDYIIKNGDFISRHGMTMSRRAARLALEIHARIPVLPRSLFCPGDLSQHLTLTGYTLLTSFTPTLMGRIMDHNYVLSVSWRFQEGRFNIVHDSMNTFAPIKDWRRSNPDFISITRVMREVAKAIQYIDSMDVHLHNSFDLRDIFLDSEYHVKVFPWGEILSLTRFSLEELRQNNIFILGCTFYELYFGTELYRDYFHFEDDMIQGPQRPREPEISNELWQLIQRCYSMDLRSRPAIDEIVQEMESWELG